MIKDIENYLFTEDDYKTFSRKYCFDDSIDANRRRSIVQNKLKTIHTDISKSLLDNNLEISQHYNQRNLTSLPFINATTSKAEGINWMGLRYGITASKAKELGFPITGKDKISSFLDHQCFQIDIFDSGIQIGLFHSTKNGTFDSAYIEKQLKSNNIELISAINNEVNNLKGLGLCWEIGDKVFNIDAQDSNTFCDFYIHNIQPGIYVKCVINIPKYDIRLTKDNIASTCEFYINQLYDLYKILSWNKNNKEVYHG